MILSEVDGTFHKIHNFSEERAEVLVANNEKCELVVEEDKTCTVTDISPNEPTTSKIVTEVPRPSCEEAENSVMRGQEDFASQWSWADFKFDENDSDDNSLSDWNTSVDRQMESPGFKVQDLPAELQTKYSVLSSPVVYSDYRYLQCTSFCNNNLEYCVSI